MADLNGIPDDLDLDLSTLIAAAEPWFVRLAVADQRVQAAPDTRTIRYYQTIGLLDRPMRYDGRSARYGTRHLLQLVAIRVLQTGGLSLAQVQSMLAGASIDELQQVIGSAIGSTESVEPSRTRSTEPQPNVSQAPAPSTPTALVAVELAPGVVVTIDRRINPDFARTIDVLRQALVRAHNNAVDALQGDQS